MKFIFLSIICLWSNLIFAQKNIINIGVSHYPPYSDKNLDSYGLFPTYLTKFFSNKGYKVNYSFIPYIRGLELAKKQELLDFIIIAQNSEKKISEVTPVKASNNFFQLKFCLFHKKDSSVNKLEYNDLNDLKPYKIITTNINPFIDQIKAHKLNHTMISDVESGLKMVELERVDIYLLMKSIGLYYLKKLGLDPKSITCSKTIYTEDIKLITTRIKKNSKVIDEFNEYIKQHPLNYSP